MFITAVCVYFWSNYDGPRTKVFIIPSKFDVAISELRRELGRVSDLNYLINWHHHIKGHVEKIKSLYGIGGSCHKITDL